MKFFSEKTDKYYDTADECIADEKKYDEAVSIKKKLEENRTARQKEVEDAILDCQNKLNNFLNDYGSFEMKFPKDMDFDFLNFIDLN